MAHVSIAEKVLSIFKSTCNKYQVEEKAIDHGTQLEISNSRDRAKVNIYNSGKIVLGGKETSLKNELQKTKDQIDSNPEILNEIKATEPRLCATRYDILLSDMRDKIKESLSSLSTEIEIENNPKANIQYIAKLKRDSLAIAITQFTNGTLVLQGKDDSFHYDVCNLVDETANPTEKEVTVRFLSGSEDSLEAFTAKYTPTLTEKAESSVKDKLGLSFDFLEAYDKKYFIAAESLLIVDIPLPEFSPIVMPASKGFEGFAKKLLIKVGFFPPDHFKSKKATFSYLNNQSDSNRKAFCGAKKYNESFLVRISSGLDFCRNFMLHSDDSHVTKVESLKDAQDKLEHIIKETKDIFEYFNLEYEILE